MPTRRSWSSGCAASAAIGALGLLLAATATAATTESVHRPSEVKKKGRVVVFDLESLDASQCEGSTLALRGSEQPLDADSVRTAVATKGMLKTKLPGDWLSGVSRAKRPKLARKARLEILFRPDEEGVSEPGAPSEELPTDPPPEESPPTDPPPEELPPTDPPPEESPPADPPPAPPADEGLRVGLVTNAQGWGMNSGSVLDEAGQTGAQWLREDFEWEVIEPQNDVWKWTRYDNLLLQAAQHGMRVLPLLYSTPSWAGSAWNEIPSDPAEYAEYTGAVVARYGPGGTFWDSHPEIASFAPEYFEIWNEPYLSSFSAGGVNAGRYARLVKAAVTVGRDANPDARFLLQAEQTPAGDARHTFIDDMYAAVPDLNSYFDAVAVHPYPGSSSPDDPRGGWGFPRLADARAKFVAHGAEDKPLWITEIGWSTCPSSPSYCTSESKQAEYMERMFELLRTKYSSYVQAAFCYHRTDLNSIASDKEGWFGLERLDGSRKPAYDVFRQAASQSI